MMRNIRSAYMAQALGVPTGYMCAWIQRGCDGVTLGQGVREAQGVAVELLSMPVLEG